MKYLVHQFLLRMRNVKLILLRFLLFGNKVLKMQDKGAFNDYVDKKKWYLGGPKSLLRLFFPMTFFMISE